MSVTTGNIGLIPAASGSELTSSFDVLNVFFSSPTYGSINPTASIASIKVNVIEFNNSGSAGELVFHTNSPENSGSVGDPVLTLFATGSNNEPRVGIGFSGSEKPIKAFDIRSKIDNSIGTEILLRSSRASEGAQVGDEAGLINFVIDSSSFNDITTTGSVATIKSVVDSVSATDGVAGRLVFGIQRNVDTAIDMLEMGYGGGSYADFYRAFTSRSFEIVDFNPQTTATQNASFVLSNGTNPYVIVRTDNPGTGNQGGLIQVNDKFGTGNIFLHGPTGEITASSLTLDDSFQYNNVILESTESSISAGNTTLGEFPTASYKAVYVDYLIISGSSKARAGHLMSTWKGSSVTFTDTSAKSIGNTSDAEFSVILNGANADLKISSSDSYDVTISSRGTLDGTNFALGGGNISPSPFPFTGSAVISGSLDITGSIIPGGDGIHDLGDATHFWRTASIEHIVTLGDTIEFRDSSNKGTSRGTLKLDTEGGLKVRGSSNALTIVSASHGHFTGDMNVAGDLAISGISDVSSSIAEAFNNGGNVDTGSLVLTSSFNIFTSSIQSEVNTLIAATSSYNTSTANVTLDTSTLVITDVSAEVTSPESQSIDTTPTSSNAIFYNYVLENYQASGSNRSSRAGNLILVNDGTNVNLSDYTVTALGSGDNPYFSASIEGTDTNLYLKDGQSYYFKAVKQHFVAPTSSIVLPTAGANLPLLDDHSGAIAAYGLRKLSSTYSGDAIRIREDGSNTETDIGFSSDGGLDTDAISTHCGSNLGYVVTWYDQSGNSRDAGQTTHAQQPLIYSQSAVMTRQTGRNSSVSLPALHFGSDLITNLQISSTASAVGHAFMVLENDSNGANFLLLFQGASNNHHGYYNGNIYENFGNTTRISISPTASLLDPHLYTVLTSASRFDIRINGQQEYTRNTNTVSFSGGQTWQLGRNGQGYHGTISEFVMFDTSYYENESSIESNINSYYQVYHEGLLINHPGASAAYSVRRLDTTYTGDAMDIRRASDNTEQTIGFTSAGDLDTGSIETFCNGTECYVATWYDQSGNNRNAEENTTSYQPLIYSASAVITENNKPAIDFTGNPGFKVLYARQVLSQSHFCVAEFIDTGHGRIITQTIQGSGTYDWTGTNPYIPLQRSATNKVGSNAGGYKASNSVINNSQNLFTSIHSGILITNVVNNTSIATASSILSSSIELFQIKRAANQTMDGTLQEYILYDNNQLSNRTAIETNINDYFDIY